MELKAVDFASINGGGDKTQAFIQKMKMLMDMERDAEMEESANLLSEFSLKELEKRSMAITKLFIKHVSTGIYGRVLLHLQRGEKSQKEIEKAELGEDKTDKSEKLRKFRPGDMVGLLQSDGKSADPNDQGSVEGIVYKVHHDEIVVSFNEMFDFENFKQPLNLCLLANQVTYQRCKGALDRVATCLG